MLLRQPRHNTAPVDYLYVRLRARRRALGQGTRLAPADAEVCWQVWRREVSWVYDRLPPGLHRLLQPVFAGEELPQLQQALRSLAAGDRPGIDRACRASLLSAQVQEVLQTADELGQALERLANRADWSAELFAGAWPCYLAEGPGGLERLLASRLLRAGLEARRGSLTAAWCRYRIDMRNLLGIAKHLRWQVRTPPAWLNGGELARGPVWQAWQQRDPDRLAELVRQFAGQAAASGNDLEARLWRGLAGRLRSWYRDPLQPGLVLAYLLDWQLLLRSRATA